MKKTISILLALVTVGCGVSFGGTRDPESQMAVVKNGEIIRVIYKTTSSSQVKVTISDADGNEVFAEKVNSYEGFIRPYNFSQLPKGDYKISLTDQTGEHTKKVSTADKEWVARVVKLKSRDDKYLVSVPYQGMGEFAVQIFDRNDQLVFVEKPNPQEDFAMVFNLKELEGATFRLVNQSGDEKFFPAD